MALFNGGYPATYQPIYAPYQQPFQMPQVPQNQSIQSPVQQPQQNIIWVEGEADARSFQLAPNTTMPLWDRNQQVIYYKSADASGMPSLKILDYTIRNQSAQNGPVSVPAPEKGIINDYVTKSEFEAIIAKYDALKADFDALSNKVQTKSVKKGVTADE